MAEVLEVVTATQSNLSELPARRVNDGSPYLQSRTISRTPIRRLRHHQRRQATELRLPVRLVSQSIAHSRNIHTDKLRSTKILRIGETPMSNDKKNDNFLRNMPAGINPASLPKEAINIGTVEQLLGSNPLQPKKVK
jgi:hypothetical protein